MRIKEILTEMPIDIGHMDSVSGMYQHILEYIKSFKKHPETIDNLPGGLKRHSVMDRIYYWYEKNDSILLAMVLNKKDDGNLHTRVLVKNPYHSGPPHATDLYSAIRKATPNNIHIMSDYSMTPDGFKVWSRLLNLGHKIGVYDYEDTSSTIRPIENIEELKSYFSEDSPKKISSFVLIK